MLIEKILKTFYFSIKMNTECKIRKNNKYTKIPTINKINKNNKSNNNNEKNDEDNEDLLLIMAMSCPMFYLLYLMVE